MFSLVKLAKELISTMQKFNKFKVMLFVLWELGINWTKVALKHDFSFFSSSGQSFLALVLWWMLLVFLGSLDKLAGLTYMLQFSLQSHNFSYIGCLGSISNCKGIQQDVLHTKGEDKLEDMETDIESIGAKCLDWCWSGVVVLGSVCGTFLHFF